MDFRNKHRIFDTSKQANNIQKQIKNFTTMLTLTQQRIQALLIFAGYDIANNTDALRTFMEFHKLFQGKNPILEVIDETNFKVMRAKDKTVVEVCVMEEDEYHEYVATLAIDHYHSQIEPFLVEPAKTYVDGILNRLIEKFLDDHKATKIKYFYIF